MPQLLQLCVLYLHMGSGNAWVQEHQTRVCITRTTSARSLSVAVGFACRAFLYLCFACMFVVAGRMVGCDGQRRTNADTCYFDCLGVPGFSLAGCTSCIYVYTYSKLCIGRALVLNVLLHVMCLQRAAS
jgi:hypothetical protein